MGRWLLLLPCVGHAVMGAGGRQDPTISQARMSAARAIPALSRAEFFAIRRSGHFDSTPRMHVPALMKCGSDLALCRGLCRGVEGAEHCGSRGRDLRQQGSTADVDRSMGGSATGARCHRNWRSVSRAGRPRPAGAQFPPLTRAAVAGTRTLSRICAGSSKLYAVVNGTSVLWRRPRCSRWQQAGTRLRHRAQACRSEARAEL